MSSGGGGPTNKWNAVVNVEGFSSHDFLELLNQEAQRGNTNVVVKHCTDGEFAFFGNYAQ